VHVVNLKDAGSVEPTTVLGGPWRWIRLAELAAGDETMLEAGAVEYAVFIVDGTGTAAVDGAEVPLLRGVALTLMRGGGGSLRAGDDGLTAFLVAVDA
jgi:hypothetical protein